MIIQSVMYKFLVYGLKLSSFLTRYMIFLKLSAAY